MIEDVKFLLANHIHRERIAQQVGRPSVEALIRALHRCGEHELASLIQQDPAEANHPNHPAPITKKELRKRNGINE